MTAQPLQLGTVSIHKLFPVGVMETTLPDAQGINEALRSTILNNKAAHEGITRSNVLGWHSDTEMLRWGGEAAKALGVTLLQLCGLHTEDMGMQGNEPRYEMAMDMWANVSPAGASNQFHAHAGALWSAVYYVDNGGDPNGKLVLLDPNFPTNRMYAPDLQFVGEEGEKFPSLREFEPAPGKMVVFPSWLSHAVKPHEGPRDRISIAMNVMAIPVRR